MHRKLSEALDDAWDSLHNMPAEDKAFLLGFFAGLGIIPRNVGPVFALGGVFAVAFGAKMVTAEYQDMRAVLYDIPKQAISDGNPGDK